MLTMRWLGIHVVMTVVQLGFLLTISAPFILAVWVAFRRWPNPIVNTEGMLEAVGEMDGRGLTRARFAAETLDVEREVRGAAEEAGQLARDSMVRLDLAV